MLTIKLIRERFAYDSQSGLLVWRATGDIAGSLRKDGRIQVGIGRKLYWAHRLAWAYHYGKWPRKNIDHIDGNPSNNAIANLREATHAENMRNRKQAASGHIGIDFRTDIGKWRARITVDRKEIVLGYFKRLADARSARSKAELQYFGAFSRSKES